MTIAKGRKRGKGVYQLNQEGGMRWRVVATRRHPLTGKRVARQRVVEANSLIDAKAARIALQRELDADLSGRVRPRRIVTVTVADFAEHWLEDKASDVRRSTADEYLRVLKTWLVPFMGGVYLTDLNRDLVRDYVAWMEEQRMTDGLVYADSTLKSVNRVSRTFLRDAAAEVGVSDPTRRVRPPRSSRRKVREQRTLSEAELVALLAAVRGEAPQWHVMMHVLCYYGLRCGEARALRWEDVDLEDGVLRVQRSVARREFNATKTGDPRDLPLVDETVAMVKLHRTDLAQLGLPVMGEALVFPSQVTGSAVWTSAVNRVLRNASKTAGIDQHVSAQVVRRTFNTLVSERARGMVVRDLMGHCSQEMTNRYHHTRMDEKRAVLEGLVGRVAGKTQR